MFVKRILGAFARYTSIEVYTNEGYVLDYDTVGEFMDSGLMTYTDAEPSSFTIENNTIIIHLN